DLRVRDRERHVMAGKRTDGGQDRAEQLPVPPPAPALIALARLLARQAAREARACHTDAS
ncbi:hypothetical protein, partial [Rhodovulum visakhapatnamense]